MGIEYALRQQTYRNDCQKAMMNLILTHNWVMEKMKEHAAHLTGKMLGQAKTFGLYVGGTLIVTGQTTAIKPAVDYVREQAEYVRDTLGMQAQKILGNKEEYISWLTSLKNAYKKLDLHNFSDPKDDIDAQTALNEFETEVGKTLPKFRPTLLKITLS